MKLKLSQVRLKGKLVSAQDLLRLVCSEDARPNQPCLRKQTRSKAHSLRRFEV